MTQDSPSTDPSDLAIIGGGVNGCGITRDVAALDAYLHSVVSTA